jgi:hypothetical protein
VDDLSPTPPRVCGLAIALPVDLAAIAAALDGGPFADYVGRATSLGSPQCIWQHGFDRVAKGARALAREASGLGVSVVENACLSDLRRLFSTCAVVTIIAHWRGPDISRGDIGVEAAAIIDRMANERSETTDLLRAGLPPDWRETIEREAAPSARSSRLAELLDGRLRRPPPIVPPPDGVKWDMDPISLWHFNREALESWWPEAFVPGNQLELADGLQTPERIATCVPKAWSGIADMSNCQSAQLIEWVKQGRGDRLVLANEQETNPLSRMAMLSAIYSLLVEGSRNYADARLALADALIDESAGRIRSRA